MNIMDVNVKYNWEYRIKHELTGIENTTVSRSLFRMSLWFPIRVLSLERFMVESVENFSHGQESKMNAKWTGYLLLVKRRYWTDDAGL